MPIPGGLARLLCFLATYLFEPFQIPSMKKYITLLLAPVMLAVGCTKNDGDDVKDSAAYYQEYEVSYNKTKGETWAYATYKVANASGEKVILSNNASVVANNKASNTTTIDPARYYWNFPTIVDVNFLLKKAGGMTITNNMSRAEIGDINITTKYPKYVTKADGIGFRWEGDPLQEGETLTASIISGTDLVSATKEFTGDSVYFSKAELHDLPAEWSTVQLTRTKKLSLDAADGSASGVMKLSVVTSTYANLFE